MTLSTHAGYPQLSSSSSQCSLFLKVRGRGVEGMFKGVGEWLYRDWFGIVMQEGPGKGSWTCGRILRDGKMINDVERQRENDDAGHGEEG